MKKSCRTHAALKRSVGPRVGTSGHQSRSNGAYVIDIKKEWSDNQNHDLTQTCPSISCPSSGHQVAAVPLPCLYGAPDARPPQGNTPAGSNPTRTMIAATRAATRRNQAGIVRPQAINVGPSARA